MPEDTTAPLRKKRIDKAKAAKVPLRKRKLSTRKANLSEAHRAVVDAWFANGCVSKRRALISAGYSPTSAGQTAVGVFAREDVQDEIHRRRSLRSARSTVTEDRVVAEMAKLAFVNFGELLEVNEDGTAFLDLNNMTDAHRAAMTEFQVEQYDEKKFHEDENKDSDEPGTVILVPVKKSRIKFGSKQAALDSLARILGMFKDKIQVDGVTSLVERIAASRKRIHEEATKEKF